MLQQHVRHLTDKAIEALNVGSVEMVNLHQNLLTPDFILIGLLEQEDSMLVKLLEFTYPDDKNLSDKILGELFKAQEGELWNLLSSAGIIIMAPMFVLALIIRKHFVQGMTMGAVR